MPLASVLKILKKNIIIFGNTKIILTFFIILMIFGIIGISNDEANFEKLSIKCRINLIHKDFLNILDKYIAIPEHKDLLNVRWILCSRITSISDKYVDVICLIKYINKKVIAEYKHLQFNLKCGNNEYSGNIQEKLKIIENTIKNGEICSFKKTIDDDPMVLEFAKEFDNKRFKFDYRKNNENYENIYEVRCGGNYIISTNEKNDIVKFIKKVRKYISNVKIK